jgi:nicotinic acid mononucleotide adenylyltransferase
MENRLNLKLFLKRLRIAPNTVSKQMLEATHLTHIEDLLFDAGDEGAKLMFNTFDALFEELKGNTSDKIKTTLKVDGAPAIIAASSYLNYPPFVATKGAFAKEPKLCFTPQDANKYYGDKPDLVKKLVTALRYIPLLKIPKDQVWQGDFLFIHDDLKAQKIGDKNYVTFHPNTIVYAFPVESEKGKQVLNSDIGIVWHTRYQGPNFQQLTASYDVKISELAQIPKTFMIDANIDSIAGSITLTAEETQFVEDKLNQAKKIYSSVGKDVLNYISENDEINLLLNTFENDVIKKRHQQIQDPKKYAEDLVKWVDERYQAEIDSKKTDKGKASRQQKKDAVLQFFSEENMKQLISVFTIQKLLVEVKNLFLQKLNSFGPETFLQLISNEYKPTSQEGFVVSDVQGNVYKFVDRLEFSYSNFSQNVLKGWNSDKRDKQNMNEIESVQEFIRFYEKMMPDDLKKEILNIVKNNPKISVESLQKAYNSLVGGDALKQFLSKALVSKFSENSSVLPRVVDSIYGFCERLDHNDCIKIFEYILKYGLIDLSKTSEGELFDCKKIITSSIPIISRMTKIGAGDVSEILEILFDKLMNLAYGIGNGITTTIGRGEVLFALIIRGAVKPKVGDLQIGDEKIEIKGTNGILKGMGKATPQNTTAKQAIVSLIMNYVTKLKLNKEIIPGLVDKNNINIGTSVGNKSLTTIFEMMDKSKEVKKQFSSEFSTTLVTTLHGEEFAASKDGRKIIKDMTVSVEKNKIESFNDTFKKMQFLAYKFYDEINGGFIFFNESGPFVRIVSDDAFIAAEKNGILKIGGFSFYAKNVSGMMVSVKGPKHSSDVEESTYEHAQRMMEQEAKNVVLTFGRFSPPTKGHSLIFKKMESLSPNKKYNLVFASHTQDSKKNPIDYNSKIKFLHSIIKENGYNVTAVKSGARTILEALVEIYEKISPNAVTIVVGQDRIKQFKTLVDKYNGYFKDGVGYEFDRINFVSSGDRDADAEDITGLSASKMREYAARNDYKDFKKGIDSKDETLIKSIFDATRKGMTISENVEQFFDLLLNEAPTPLTAQQKVDNKNATNFIGGGGKQAPRYLGGGTPPQENKYDPNKDYTKTGQAMLAPGKVANAFDTTHTDMSKAGEYLADVYGLGGIAKGLHSVYQTGRQLQALLSKGRDLASIEKVIEQSLEKSINLNDITQMTEVERTSIQGLMLKLMPELLYTMAKRDLEAAKIKIPGEEKAAETDKKKPPEEETAAPEEKKQKKSDGDGDGSKPKSGEGSAAPDRPEPAMAMRQSAIQKFLNLLFQEKEAEVAGQKEPKTKQENPEEIKKKFDEFMVKLEKKYKTKIDPSKLDKPPLVNPKKIFVIQGDGSFIKEPQFGEMISKTRAGQALKSLRVDLNKVTGKNLIVALRNNPELESLVEACWKWTWDVSEQLIKPANYKKDPESYITIAVGMMLTILACDIQKADYRKIIPTYLKYF